MGKAITARNEDYSQWYNDLVLKSELADYSAVRGCMIIKPYGFTLWENMRDALDKMFKDSAVRKKRRVRISQRTTFAH